MFGKETNKRWHDETTNQKFQQFDLIRPGESIQIDFSHHYTKPETHTGHPHNATN